MLECNTVNTPGYGPELSNEQLEETLVGARDIELQDHIDARGLPLTETPFDDYQPFTAPCDRAYGVPGQGCDVTMHVTGTRSLRVRLLLSYMRELCLQETQSSQPYTGVSTRVSVLYALLSTGTSRRSPLLGALTPVRVDEYLSNFHSALQK